MKRISIVFALVVLALITNIAFPGIVFAQDEQLVPPNAKAIDLFLPPLRTGRFGTRPWIYRT